MSSTHPSFVVANVLKRAEKCLSEADMTSPIELKEALLEDVPKTERNAKMIAGQLLYTNQKLKTLINVKGIYIYTFI